MSWIIGNLLVFSRLAAMMLVAPVLGDRSVPVYVKVLLALTVSLCIAPLVIANSQFEPTSADAQLVRLTSLVIQEIVVGALLGIGILIIYSTAMMIGATIGQISGLQLDSISPSDNFGRQPTTQLIGITAAATFVLVGGPELLITSVIDSFLAVPMGESTSALSALDVLIAVLQQSFELTIRAVAPAIGTFLISTILVGALSRMVPQLNLFQVGLASNQGLMMIAIFLTLSGCIWLAIDDVERASEFINQSLRDSPANPK